MQDTVLVLFTGYH